MEGGGEGRGRDLGLGHFGTRTRILSDEEHFATFSGDLAAADRPGIGHTMPKHGSRLAEAQRDVSRP